MLEFGVGPYQSWVPILPTETGMCLSLLTSSFQRDGLQVLQKAFLVSKLTKVPLYFKGFCLHFKESRKYLTITRFLE